MYVPTPAFVSPEPKQVPSPFDDLPLDPSSEGLRLRVRVSPGARKEALLGVYGDALKVAVRAPPEKGRANKAVIEFLAGVLAVSRGSVTLVAGEGSRDKSVVVSGVEEAAVRARLAAAVAGVGRGA